MATQPQQYIFGVYDDEEKALAAVGTLRAQGIQVTDVYSPFPIHGIDQALGLRRSRLPKVAFWAGVVGCASALFMQVWMLGIDWPIDVGGKPYAAVPSFIPVTFELTVLISSLTMAFAYFSSSNMFPGAQEQLADIRQTDDRIVVAVNALQDRNGDGTVRRLLQDAGALDVRETGLTVPVAY